MEREEGALQLSFDEFVVDTEAFELLRAGSPVPVEPRVFDLLVVLASRPGYVFSRDELIAVVWKGRTVSDATISTCVKEARRALGDAAAHPKYIETVRGRGFRFSGAVETTAPAEATDPDPRLHLWNFGCLAEDAEVERATQTLATNLATLLSRVPLLRLSADPAGDEHGPMLSALRDEGVQWAVRGLVQVAGEQLAVNVQLLETASNEQVWAEHFPIEGTLVPERCVAQIVAKLEPQLLLAMLRRTSKGDTQNARKLFLEAYAMLALKGWNPTSFGKAIAMLRTSVEIDPQFALGHGLLALLLGFGARVGMEGGSLRGETLASAQTALDLDSMDSTVLGFVGCSLADVGETDRGEALLRNAVDLNPANAQALVALGSVKLARREVDEAIALLEQGMDLSPLDSRLSVWGSFLAVAQLIARNPNNAAATAATACQRHDGTYLPRIALAAARLTLGDSAGAQAALKDAQRINPGLDSAQIAALVGPKLTRQLEAILRDNAH